MNITYEDKKGNQFKLTDEVDEVSVFESDFKVLLGIWPIKLKINVCDLYLVKNLLKKTQKEVFFDVSFNGEKRVFYLGEIKEEFGNYLFTLIAQDIPYSIIEQWESIMKEYFPDTFQGL